MVDTRQSKKVLLKSFIGSNIVALGAGTPYIYSYYAPKLLERCGIPISRSSSISFSLNIGSSLLAMFGGMISDFSPALSCFVGSVTTFLAYALLAISYKKSISNVYVISLALVLVGFGSISGLFAAVKVCTTNFPKHRGTATAFPISLYALSGMMFSTMCAKFFGDNMLNVFKFLLVACSLMILVGSFTLEIDTSLEDIDECQTDIFNLQGNNNNNNSSTDIFLATSNDISYNTPNGTSNVSSIQKHVRLRSATQSPTEDLHISNSNGRKMVSNTPTSPRNLPNRSSSSKTIHNPKTYISPQFNQSARYSSDFEGYTSNIAMERISSKSLNGHVALLEENIVEEEVLTLVQKVLNSKVVQTIIDPRYITYYIILAFQMGIGQMFIYSVGFLVQVQVNTPPTSEYNLNQEKIQATQISIFAIFSFLGRLTSGPISDFLVRKLKSQRLWNVFFATFLVLISSSNMKRDYSSIISDDHSKLSLPNIRNISICTTIFGYAFGMIFGTFPSIISDTFGLEWFSTIWSICTTGGIFSVKFFTSVLANDLSSNTKNGEALCKLGSECYRHTFNTIFNLSVFGIILTSIMLFVTYWTAKNAYQRTNDDFETISLH